MKTYHGDVNISGSAMATVHTMVWDLVDYHSKCVGASCKGAGPDHRNLYGFCGVRGYEVVAQQQEKHDANAGRPLELYLESSTVNEIDHEKRILVPCDVDDGREDMVWCMTTTRMQRATVFKINNQ